MTLRRGTYIAGFILAFSLALISFIPSNTSALSCMAPLYPEIAKNGAIVVATVTDVAYSTNNGGLQTNRVTVSVERGWGQAQATMTFMNPLRRIWTGYPEGGNPIPFEKGKRYLITLGYNQGQLEAALGDCSSSFFISDTNQLQNFIDARVAEGMGAGTLFTSPQPCTSDDCGTPGTGAYCPALSTTFTRGARDTTTRPTGQVTELQKFLSDYFDIDPEEIITGFFGRITQSYVVKFQQEQNLPAFGIVGSMTRASIAKVCKSTTPTPPPYACTMEYRPVCGMPKYCEKVKVALGSTHECALGKTYGNLCSLKAEGATYKYDGECRKPAETAAPTISSFSGPTTLTTGQTGTWTINAKDPNNGALTYSIDWGDVAYMFNDASTNANSQAFVQSTTFTHSYASAGTYQVWVTVRNAAGQTAKASMTVTVTSGAAGCPTNYNPVCGQPPFRCPSDLYCPQVMPAPKTYTSMCALNADGATFLYNGLCSNTAY